jgi:hypothetical protein
LIAEGDSGVHRVEVNSQGRDTCAADITAQAGEVVHFAVLSRPHVPAVFATDELLALLLEAGTLEAGVLDAGLEDAAAEDTAALLVAALSQAAPLMTGISADAAPLVPCTPNSIDWLGWIVRFQLRLVAV